MKVKISEIAKKSGVPLSSIRYYVREGLLPPPEKVNKKMAYYDEGCIDRLKVIQHLQEKRFFPLVLIKNILRRMDEGFSLQEAERLEDEVFRSQNGVAKGFIDREMLLAQTGLTNKQLKEAESLGILIPCVNEDGKTLYDNDDVRIGRDNLRQLIDLGFELQEMEFFVKLGEEIIEKEMELRNKIVSNKTVQENIAITTKLFEPANFYRDYILRRLLQQLVMKNIKKSFDHQDENKRETIAGGRSKKRVKTSS